MSFTPPVTVAQPSETVLSPPALDPPFSLLSVVQPLPVPPQISRATDGLPKSALRLDHQRCVTARPWQNCADGDSDPMEDQADDPGYSFFPVAWYVEVGCPTGASNFDRWAELALQDVRASSAHAMEEALQYSASLTATQGTLGTTMPTLATTASLLSGAAQNPRDGIARLLSTYTDCNHASGRSVLHVPNVLAPYLRFTNTIEPAGAKLRTPLGTDAYLGTGLNAPQAPFDSADQDPGAAGSDAYVYVSGPVFAQLGDPYITADPTGAIRASGRRVEGFSDIRRGEQGVYAVRRAIFAFDTCCVYAVKVRIVDVSSGQD